MSDLPEAQPTIVAPTLAAHPTEIQLQPAPIKGVCLIEIWRMGGNKPPSVFWREVQADGSFSLWRFMDAPFAKRALKLKEFTLDKDGRQVKYAARPFNSAVKATIEDYQRVRKIQAAYRDFGIEQLCPDCQGSKEIQATRPMGGGKVQRFVCECPTCKPYDPNEPKLDADEGTTTTAEAMVADYKPTPQPADVYESFGSKQPERPPHPKALDEEGTTGTGSPPA